VPRYRPPKRSREEVAESAKLSFQHKREVLKRYRKLGVEWGAFIGAMIGVIGGGMQLKGWENPLAGWAAAIVSISAVGGLVGYFFYDLIFGTQIQAAIDAGDWGEGGGGDGGGGGD
jgi:hypothetical protein